ncbi:hypothetical protein N9988_00465 [bacterium]|nr:hypothetical protein [bacterium]
MLEKIVLLAIVFSTMPFAFSESTYTTEEALVIVPFDYHGQQCYLVSETVYHCNWQGHIEPFTIEDLEIFKDVLSEEVYQEELEKLELRNTPIEIEEPVFTETELKIKELEKKLSDGKADATDSVYLNALKELNTCLAGQTGSRSAPIQNEIEFEVTSFEHWKTNNIEVGGDKLGTILKNTEACRAQSALEYKVLSEQYRNLVDGEADVQFSLLEELNGVQALDFELYNKNSDRIDMNGICDNNQYTWSNKIMMGCEDTRVFEGTTHKGTSGKITYFSGTIGEYQKYLNENNRYATQDDLRNAELKAESILKEILEENTWYNRE